MPTKLFHGFVPGLSRDCPGILLKFPGKFVYVLPLVSKQKATHKQKLTFTCSRDNPKKLFVLLVFLPRSESQMNTCNAIWEKLLPEKYVYVTDMYFSGNEFPKQRFMHVISSGWSVLVIFSFVTFSRPSHSFLGGHRWPSTAVKKRPLPRKLRKKSAKGFPGHKNNSKKSQKLLVFKFITVETQRGTQGVRARYDTELPPFISIVWHASRPVILGMGFLRPLQGLQNSCK